MWKDSRANLDEGHSDGVLLDVVLDGVAHPHNELMGDHKDQDVSSFY